MSDDNSRSPYEQGELQSSPSPEFVRTKYKKERQFSLSPKRVETIDDIIVVDRDSEDDTLDIKPPQTQSGKRERSHKHKHKDDKRRDRDRRERDHGRDRDRVRSVHGDKHRPRQDRGDDRQVDRLPNRPDRSHREKRDHRDRDNNRDKHREKPVERIVVERIIEKERIVITETREERELRESKKREQSLMERERLEEKEREKQRDIIKQTREEKQRKIEEREKRKNDAEREKRKLDEKRAQAARQAREKSRPEKRHRSRSRESHRKSHVEKRDDRKQYGEPVEKTRKRGPRTPEEPKDDVIELDPSEPEAEVVQSESEAATESESDSESDSSSGTSGEGEEESDASNKDEDESEKHPVHNTGKLKSKFDEHTDNESEHDSVSEDENRAYIADSPPPSPIEEEVKLPPYLPAIQGCRSVEEFRCLNRIEEGTYGVVYRAKDKKNDEIVALKRLKMEKEKEGFPITSLREINTLLKAQHPNIVTVREIVVGSNMDKIYIVMDYVEHDLKSLMEVMKSPFSIGETKTLLKQLLRAVNHLHDNWILHRDLKTSNLLFSHKGILKVGDFGLAREYGSPLRQYTPIVVTLWYRAPELLLGCKQYSTAIDLWSVGCIFAEFLTMKPLWPGKSEIDELNRIFKDLGTPNEKIWPGVSELPGMKKCSFTEYPYNTIRNRFGTYLSDLGSDLLNRFLAYSPSRRITAEEGLNHTYFTESPLPVDPSMFPTWPAKSEQSARKHISSPKPPSGGKAYSRLVSEEDNLGFHMSTAAKGAASGNPGFMLKF